jgi:hypothetical protein
MLFHDESRFQNRELHVAFLQHYCSRQGHAKAASFRWESKPLELHGITVEKKHWALAGYQSGEIGPLHGAKMMPAHGHKPGIRALCACRCAPRAANAIDQVPIGRVNYPNGSVGSGNLPSGDERYCMPAEMKETPQQCSDSSGAEHRYFHRRCIDYAGRSKKINPAPQMSKPPNVDRRS